MALSLYEEGGVGWDDWALLREGREGEGREGEGREGEGRPIIVF